MWYNLYPWRSFCFSHGLIYSVMSTILIGFVILTIIFASLWLKCDIKSIILNNTNNSAMNYTVENGIIGFPPLLPNDGKYVQWIYNSNSIW
jgi:hypothetical protein